jgi:hypothetical protein
MHERVGEVHFCIEAKVILRREPNDGLMDSTFPPWITAQEQRLAVNVQASYQLRPQSAPVQKETQDWSRHAWQVYSDDMQLFRPNRFGRSFGRKIGDLYDEYVNSISSNRC